MPRRSPGLMVLVAAVATVLGTVTGPAARAQTSSGTLPGSEPAGGLFSPIADTLDRGAAAPAGGGPADLAAPAGDAAPADDTGFDPFNRRKDRSKALPLTQRQREAARKNAAPLPAEAAPGTHLPAAVVVPPRMVRRGGPPIDTTSVLNVPTTVAIARKSPPAADDPFAPTGIRVGSFVMRPAIEIKGGYETNPTRVDGLAGSSFTTVAPELSVRSDWERHSLEADLRGSYTWYGSTYSGGTTQNDGTIAALSTPEVIDRPSMDSRVRGRIDVDRFSHADVEGRVLISTDNPGSPNIQTGLKRFPIVTTVGGTAGYTQGFNRLEVTGKGTIDHVSYTDSELTDGTTSGNGDREYDQYGGSLRIGYELKPGLKPFVESGADTRVHAQELDRNGYDRDSVGTYVKAGTSFEITRKLTGEGSVGWLWRSYRDPALTGPSGLTVDAALAYTATPLTTVTLTATTAVGEIIVPDMSGVFSRDIGLKVEHAFRRWLIGTAQVGFGLDDYVGSNRVDDRYLVSFAMLYKLSREFALTGEVRHEWLRSNVEDADWTDTTVTVGMRVQR
ncbi:Outer membrane protein/protective antigen OMA87 [Rhodovulum sp. PH10]|nr:Outer membrane protein/protective antigen OMA87 [Rhodovulum sp. PH10]